MNPTLLVLAAGMGSRFGGLKQIEPIGPHGETILDYSIYDALGAGFAKAVFVLRREIEETFRNTIAARFEDRIAVEYVFQDLNNLPAGFAPPPGRTKPWGTTHAVLTANAIHEPFAVINADDFYGPESYRLLTNPLQSGASDYAPDYAMVGFRLRNTLSAFGSVARGLCQITPEGYLQSVEELTHIEPDGDHAINTSPGGLITPLTGDETVSMNMWGFTPRIFPQLQTEFRSFLELNAASLKSECYLPTAVNALIQSRQAQVQVLRTSDAWFGVTYREDHPRVVESIRQLIRDGLYPEALWS
jgi:hypothetical protein